MFNLEADMKAPVSRWLSKQRMHVAEEFHTGWGICDLVGCRFNAKKVAYRTRQWQRQPLGSPESVFIYNQLPDVEKTRRGIRIDVLNSRLAPFISTQQIRRTLDRLAATNHVRVTRTGTFQKVNGWAPLHSKLVAVELKLNRLTEVIEQAKANRAFATHSYVALPHAVASRSMQSSVADALRNEGLGLISVSKTRCSVLLEATIQPDYLDESSEMWVVENFWRTYRGKH